MEPPAGLGAAQLLIAGTPVFGWSPSSARRWTQEALRWLREIRDYIARDNPEAARRTAAGIVDRVEVLKTFPQIGQRYEGVTDREVRILLYGPATVPELQSWVEGVEPPFHE